MNEVAYLQGFLVTTTLLAIEHAWLYRFLRPNDEDEAAVADRKVLTKFILGVLAILAGCAWIAWRSGYAIAVLSPVAASLGGAVIVAAYAWRWTWERITGRIKDAAYRRGRIHGLSDKADIKAEERDGGR
jgi:hypothetical protein